MHGRVIYDPECLGSLSFNPITGNNFTGPSLDLDPDQHFFRSAILNTILKMRLTVLPSPGLRFSHLCISMLEAYDIIYLN